MGHDFKYDFQTPPEFCKFMAAMVPEYYELLLEPTPGIGNLYRALRSRGFDVTAPDDFFLMDWTMRQSNSRGQIYIHPDGNYYESSHLLYLDSRKRPIRKEWVVYQTFKR